MLDMRQTCTLAVLLAVMCAPAEARQRGGVVHVIPPDEVARMIEEGNCILPEDAYEDDDPRLQPTRRGMYRAPRIPERISTYWDGEVTVTMLFDISAEGDVVNGRIAQYAYHDRTRHFSRGQRRVLEPELLTWLALPTYEYLGGILPLSGCRSAITFGFE